MNDITIIGFTGFKRSGKDEAGNILKNNYHIDGENNVVFC